MKKVSQTWSIEYENTIQRQTLIGSYSLEQAVKGNVEDVDRDRLILTSCFVGKNSLVLNIV